LAKQLQPVWKAFDEAGKEIVNELDNDLIGALDNFETAITGRSLYDRIISRLELKTEEK